MEDDPTYTDGEPVNHRLKCPKCEHTFDFVDTDDCWDGFSAEIGEAVEGMSVNCPKCKQEFEFDIGSGM